MFQSFSMRQRRRHLHLHDLHALPRHWSTGSHRVGRWNFGTTFRRAVLCHNGPSPSNIMKNQEGPADLMSFNAFFYFCTEFELFPKHAPGSPAVHGGSWSWSKMGNFERFQGGKRQNHSNWSNPRLFNAPVFFCSMECVQKTLGASTSWRWFTTLQRWSKSCPLNPLRWPLLDPKRLEDSKSCSNRGTNIYITISSIVPICWNTVYHIY